MLVCWPAHTGSPMRWRATSQARFCFTCSLPYTVGQQHIWLVGVPENSESNLLKHITSDNSGLLNTKVRVLRVTSSLVILEVLSEESFSNRSSEEDLKL